MSLTTTIAEKGIPLLRDLARWGSWERISQRYRSWTVREWLEPYNALTQFGNQSTAAELIALRSKLHAIGYPITEEQEKRYKPLYLEYTAKTSELVYELTTLVLEGALVVKGYRSPMIHGAPYLPISRSEWLILHLDVQEGTAEGEGIKYVGMTIGRTGTKLFFQRCHTII